MCRSTNVSDLDYDSKLAARIEKSDFQTSINCTMVISKVVKQHLALPFLGPTPTCSMTSLPGAGKAQWRVRWQARCAGASVASAHTRHRPLGLQVHDQTCIQHSQGGHMQFGLSFLIGVAGQGRKGRALEVFAQMGENRLDGGLVRGNIASVPSQITSEINVLEVLPV